MLISSYRRVVTILCMFFCVAITYAHSSYASAESGDRYRLGTYYCELEVGNEIYMYIYDRKDEDKQHISDGEIKWYTDSDDIVINESGDATAVKCSSEIKSYANIYAEYKGTTYRCEVIIFAKGKCKDDYKIILPKNVKYCRVGQTYKLNVKGSGKKKIKWYVGEEGYYYKGAICKRAKIDQKGNLSILACRDDPDKVYVYAEVDGRTLRKYIETQPPRNKKEKKELKKLLNKTSLSAKNKKKAMTHYNKYCYWDGSGHLEELNLTECGLKGKVSLKSFKHLKSIDLSGNKIKKIDISANKSLNSLNLMDNSLGSIDITNNSGLTDVNLGNNKLSRLDISHNTNLKVLDVDSNRIENINFDNNRLLEKLHISLNPITKLDNLGVCSELTELKVDNNEWMYREGEYSWQDGYLEAPKSYDTLQMIDVSNNLKLKTLAADWNPNLKIVKLPNRSELDCLSLESTGVSELDITGCTGLSRLYLFGSGVGRISVPNPYLSELSCNKDTVFVCNGTEYNYKEFKKASMESGVYFRFLFGNKCLFSWDTYLYGRPDEDDYEYRYNDSDEDDYEYSDSDN